MQIHAIVNLPLSLPRAVSGSIYLRVVQSLVGKKKLPGSPVSMPTIINVGYFMGRAGELLVLGNGPDRSSRSHRAEVLYPSVSSSLGRRRSRHRLIFTACPLPGQVGAATRRTGEQLQM